MKTRSLFLVPFFVSSGLTGAMAADLGALKKEPPPPPIMYQVSPWTGFYGGLSAGYNWDTRRQQFDLPDINAQSPLRLNTGGGAIGTVFLGFNYQFAQRWIIGLELDGSFLRQRREGETSASQQSAPDAVVDTNNFTLSDPTAGIPGYFVGTGLFNCYKITGSGNNTLFKTSGTDCPSTSNNNVVAWLPSNTDYINPDTGVTTTTNEILTFVPGTPGTNGTYTGNWTRTTFSYTNIVRSASVSKRVEQLATLRGRFGFLVTDNLLFYGTGGLAVGRVSARLNASSSYDYTSSTLVCNGGSNLDSVPAIDCSNAGSPSTNSESFSDSVEVRYRRIRTGLALGGGIEWKFSNNWSLRGDYLYYNLGSVRLTAGPLAVVGQNGGSFAYPTARIRFDGHLARIGIAYQFSSGEALPIVAKY